MICQNPNCNKKVKGKRRKYCSDKCQEKQLYLRKKEIYKAKQRKWNRKNPEKRKEQSRKAVDKFRKKNPKRFSDLVLKNYYKNKSEWLSRAYARKIIAFKRKINVDRVCNKCNSKDNLKLKFEVYPRKAEDIRQAIKDKKIYYLCGECRWKK